MLEYFYLQRYRLVVRTRDSHSLNRGSIPLTAEKREDVFIHPLFLYSLKFENPYKALALCRVQSKQAKAGVVGENVVLSAGLMSRHGSRPMRAQRNIPLTAAILNNYLLY